MSGLLVLNGGDEFHPGNEPQDRLLAAAAGRGPAYVVPTAAARQRPDLAVRHAREWFAALGLEILELPVLKASDAQREDLVDKAAAAGCFYLVGGDPGLVVSVLRGTPVWKAIVEAWEEGAALAGSSAGAMALCQWTLIRRRWPNSYVRSYREALGVVPRTAFLPHFDTFGQRWVDSAEEEPPIPDVVLLGVDERTAAVWDGRGWRAHGAGAVTLIRDRGREVSREGESVWLPDPGFNVA
jgi:cyanophycinase